MNFSEKVIASLLSDLTVTLNRSGNRTEVLRDYATEVCPEGAILRYTLPKEAGLEIKVVSDADTAVFFLDARAPYSNGTAQAFTAENAAVFSLGPEKPQAMTASAHQSPWWMEPSFPERFEELPARTQSVFLRLGEEHVHLLPLCGENFRCEIFGDRLCVSSGTAGLYSLRGAFLAAARGRDPYEAAARGYRAARRCGALRVPLREERRVPEFFDGFGFCTWDAFYDRLTARDVCRKLDELREKRIPIRWLLLDDGWLTVRNSRLASFEADPVKFPEGLKAAVEHYKREYGVEKVGVWHTLQGYWEGIDPESPLFEAQKENLVRTTAGRWIPAPEEEKAFRFWDAWHGYLASCGIDFVKVDNQSSEPALLEGLCPTAAGCRALHRALDASVEKHFGGAIINCMGMDMENVQARPSTAISRSSDDFFPRREGSFRSHLMQNVYNSLWHGRICCCDYDMWWSEHPSAVQSGVLRAISGSPIYVSDEVGRSNAEAIRPLTEEDGSLMRCPEAARPTADCVYCDPTEAGRCVKIFNRAGDAFAVAAFNLTGRPVTDRLSLEALPGTDAETRYVLYEYFTGRFVSARRESEIDFTLGENETAVWSVYPVRRDETGEYILMGSRSKYVPIASKKKEKVFLREIL